MHNTRALTGIAATCEEGPWLCYSNHRWCMQSGRSAGSWTEQHGMKVRPTTSTCERDGAVALCCARLLRKRVAVVAVLALLVAHAPWTSGKSSPLPAPTLFLPRNSIPSAMARLARIPVAFPLLLPESTQPGPCHAKPDKPTKSNEAAHR